MNRPLSVALLIAGIILLALGFGALDSFSSNVSEAVQGAPSDKSILLIVAGVVTSVIGGLGLVRRRA
jgi:hypothetical protein